MNNFLFLNLIYMGCSGGALELTLFFKLIDERNAIGANSKNTPSPKKKQQKSTIATISIIETTTRKGSKH